MLANLVLFVLLGCGLQRRLAAAYLLNIGLLTAGIVTSLAKGFDYEEAAVLLLILVAIWPTRCYFYRKASEFKILIEWKLLC